MIPGLERRTECAHCRSDSDRGFGFIKPNDGGEDVFCHVNDIKDGNMLREGDTVEFGEHRPRTPISELLPASESVYDDRKGKYRADNVTGGVSDDGFGKVCSPL